jgi:hypothetical protein
VPSRYNLLVAPEERIMRKASRIGVLVLGLAAAVVAQGSGFAAGDAKPEDVRKLIELTGGCRVARQVMDSVIVSMRQAHPELSSEFWAAVQSELREEDLVEALVPIYTRYLSQEDVRGLIPLYETPIVRKWVAMQPQLQLDAMPAGSRWGEDAVRRARARVQQGGATQPNPK